MLWVGIALGVSLLLALASWAWLRHRAHLLEMQRRLAWNEQSRFALEDQTQELSQQLASMAQSLKALEAARQPLPSPALSPVASGPARPATMPARNWKETEPAPLDASGFAQTMPFEMTAAEAQASQQAVQPVKQ